MGSTLEFSNHAPAVTRNECNTMDKLNERIGRLKQRSRGVSQHYQITLTADEAGKNATALSWKQEWVDGIMATHPGVYCLRTNMLDWDAQKLWQTYSSLTDI